MKMARPPLPYDFLPTVPDFALTSNDIADGKPLARPQVSATAATAPARSSVETGWAESFTSTT
jgi:hypothetical protein